MAVKKSLLLFLVLSAGFYLAAADWKKETSIKIGQEKNFPLLIESLQKYFPDLLPREQATVCVLIGYCQYKLNNPQGELFWMKKYLEEFRAADVEIGFIAAGLRQKLLQFKTSWLKDFPVIWELALHPGSAEIPFFRPPPELKLRLQTSVPCQFQLFDDSGNALAKGVLGREAETVSFAVTADFFKVERHGFRLLLTLGSAPQKEIEKYFDLELGYQVPDNIVFDAQGGELKLKGQELRPETKTETVIVSQRTVFDKQTFKKSFLKNFFIGAAFFVVGSTVLGSTITNADTSLYTKSALYGVRRVFTVAGIGFSLAALSQLPKVFKREKISAEKTVELPENRAANENLKRELDLAREKVLVRLAVKLN